MEKCINCGNKNFKKGIIEICTKCGDNYSDEEAIKVICDVVDGIEKGNKKKIIQVIKDQGHTFWKRKGEQCWSKDIVELSGLIKEGWGFA